VKVLKIADVPPPTIPAEASVAEALQVMEKEERGACAVLDNICVRDVMSQNLYTVNSKTESADALSLMMAQNIRHLPVVDDEGNLAGLLSMRNLVRHQIEELTDELNSIVAYFSADGSGG